MKLKIGVIFGGQSVEHELSILTALQVMANIDKERYEVVPIYITKDLIMYAGGMLNHIDSFKDFRLIQKYAKKVNLINKNGRFILQTTGLFKYEYNEIHLAFPIVHGKNTEDGSIQGYLQLLGIPYIGGNLYSSVVTQDKVYTREILENNKLPIIDYVWFSEEEYLDDKEEVIKKINKMNYPLIIKPARLGSGIGIRVVKDKEYIDNAILDVFKYDDKIIIEEYIDKTSEFNIAIIHNKDRLTTSAIEEIKKDGIVDYRDKAIKQDNDNFTRTYPANINKSLKQEIENYATSIYRILDCKGCVRIDFLYDSKHKKIYIDEVNSIPNFFCYYLFEDRNIDYRELLNIMIKEAICEVTKKEDINYTLDSDMFKNINNRDIGELK